MPEMLHSAATRRDSGPLWKWPGRETIDSRVRPRTPDAPDPRKRLTLKEQVAATGRFPWEIEMYLSGPQLEGRRLEVQVPADAKEEMRTAVAAVNESHPKYLRLDRSGRPASGEMPQGPCAFIRTIRPVRGWRMTQMPEIPGFTYSVPVDCLEYRDRKQDNAGPIPQRGLPVSCGDLLDRLDEGEVFRQSIGALTRDWSRDETRDLLVALRHWVRLAPCELEEDELRADGERFRAFSFNSAADKQLVDLMSAEPGADVVARFTCKIDLCRDKSIRCAEVVPLTELYIRAESKDSDGFSEADDLALTLSNAAEKGLGDSGQAVELLQRIREVGFLFHPAVKMKRKTFRKLVPDSLYYRSPKDAAKRNGVTLYIGFRAKGEMPDLADFDSERIGQDAFNWSGTLSLEDLPVDGRRREWTYVFPWGVVYPRRPTTRAG